MEDASGGFLGGSSGRRRGGCGVCGSRSQAPGTRRLDRFPTGSMPRAPPLTDGSRVERASASKIAPPPPVPRPIFPPRQEPGTPSQPGAPDETFLPLPMSRYTSPLT
ncbi:MAG: hypothetical protein Kow0092_28630 [Deferrisomatales bacterium]